MRVLVLGGSGAIGTEICRVLVREGHAVAFTCFSRKERAESLARELGGLKWFACDLRRGAQVRETFDAAAAALGGLDGVVIATGASSDSAATGGSAVAVDQIPESAYDEAMAVNTKGVFVACQAAVPHLKKNPAGGNLVLLGALSGLKPVPQPAHFAASKAALKGLTEALSKELGASGVKVNLVAPGVVEGGLSARLSAPMRETYLKHSSAGRFAKPIEIAEMAAWLATENTYITGQSLLLDGGL